MPETNGDRIRQMTIETLENFRNDYTREDSAICRAINIAIDALRQPTIESEVHHGRWIKKGSDVFECSECGESTYLICSEKECSYGYCPHCGAQMDGGTDDG